MVIILNRLIVSGIFRTNCYLFGDEITKEVCIIDPGIDSNDVKSVIYREEYKPVYLIGTHPHHDHIQCAIDIMDYFNIPLLINNIRIGKDENINLALNWDSFSSNFEFINRFKESNKLFFYIRD